MIFLRDHLSHDPECFFLIKIKQQTQKIIWRDCFQIPLSELLGRKITQIPCHDKLGMGRDGHRDDMSVIPIRKMYRILD